MATSRRRFLALAAGSAGSLAVSSPRDLLAAPVPAAAAGRLDILVLGGTKFLGPAIVDAALARGHKVTLFNRGRTNTHLYPQLEKIRGDRDPLKDEGLKGLAARRFDCVFDDNGYFPRIVGASARLLAQNGCGQYIFTSTISAYRDNRKADADEDYPLATVADPTTEEMGQSFENYGALKALCEAAARDAFGARATIVRPGYIVGPNDPTDRFTFYPVRAAKGGEMLAPGAPSDPLQIIDVRDLGVFMARLAEQRTSGTFNGCGPAKRLTIGEVVEESLAQTGRKATPVWVPGAFLREHGENGEGKIPIWAPPDGDTKGYHTWSNGRAIRAGLTFRPLPETMKDTLTWFRSLPADRQAALKAGLSGKEEAEMIAAWRATSGPRPRSTKPA